MASYLDGVNVSGMSPLFSMSGASRMTRADAAKAMESLITHQYAVAKSVYEASTNKSFPSINDAIAKKGTSRERNTPGSQHFHGKALDISIKNLSNTEKLSLMESLQYAGFTSFGFGSNILHADTRKNPTSWTYGGIKTWAGKDISALKNAVTQGFLPDNLSTNVRNTIAGVLGLPPNSSIKDIQAAIGVKPDGVVGPQTREALQTALLGQVGNVQPNATQLAETSIPTPQEAPRGLLASLFSQPTAAARDFSGVTSDELAQSLAPNANIASAGILGSPVESAPVSPVSSAPLGPVEREMLASPEIQRAAIWSGPTGTDKGLLADTETQAAANWGGTAAPVGAVERGGMLRPASDPVPDINRIQRGSASDPGQFIPMPGAQSGPRPDINLPPSWFDDSQPSTPGSNPTLDLYDAQTRAVPMIAQAGSVVDQQTAAPVSPVERQALADPATSQTPMALADYASFASMPNYPGMDQPMGIDAMTTAANASMANMPAIDPDIPLGMTPIPVPQPRPLAPLPPPVNVPQYQVASQQQQAAPPTPPPPSGMDVWQGNSPYGMATDGSTLTRNPDGTVSRYSEKYDNWSTYNPETQSWLPGGGNTPGINLPSKDRAVQFGKQGLGSAAGGLLGSALLGPIGGILGAFVARNLAEGKGILGTGGNKNTYPPAPNAFPSRPSSPVGGGNGGSNLSYSEMAAISPAAAESIARGETVGLF